MNSHTIYSNLARTTMNKYNLPCVYFFYYFRSLRGLFFRTKAKKKEFNDAMYKFALLNSFYNIVYCVIMSFKLINICVFFGSSIFCSNVYQTSSAQQFKIIFIIYIGNIFKMCSNLSYLSFTISRLIVITFYKDNAIPNFSFKKLVVFSERRRRIAPFISLTH